MGKLILFQGDSITDGNRYKDKASEWDLNHQIGHGYQFIIAATLGYTHPDRGYVFKNRAISGNQIAHLYGRWVEDTLSFAPDILSILVGVNDLNGVNMGPQRFRRIYRMLLEETLQVNPQVKFVLMEPFILPSGPMLEGYEARRDRLSAYQAATCDTAREFNAVFVPLQQGFDALAQKNEPSCWLWDGVHPTEAGHGYIAAQWLEMTKDII